MSKFRETQLSRRIDEMILAHLATHEPSSTEVAQDVINQYGHLIAEHGRQLAVAQVCSIVATRMKKTIAAHKDSPLQLKLDMGFPIDPVQTMTFIDDAGVTRYVATSRATAEHHRRYIALLQKQIRADNSRLLTAQMFYRWLQPVFNRYPGITTSEAVRLMRLGGEAA